MISSKVKKLWERAIKDDDFLDMLRKADNDEKPPNNSDDKIKAIFASIYYGWLIAKYGVIGKDLSLEKYVLGVVKEKVSCL